MTTYNNALNISAGDTLTDDGTLDDASGIHLNGGTIAGAGAIASATNVTGHGVIDLTVLGAATTIYTVQNGELTLNGAVDPSGAAMTFVIGSHDTLDFNNAVGAAASGPTIDFQGLDATLIAGGAASTLHLGKISDFAVGDKIELGSAFDNGTVSLSQDGKTVILAGADNSRQTLTFADSVSGLNVDAEGAVTICFMPGTRIRTPDGEVAVEALKRGDLVTTHLGEAKPVTWVGRQTVARRFATPLRNWPVRVKAGALGPQTPGRDLLLSPDHALWVDGVLIQAGALVNGTSVVRETDVPEAWTYYHVELDDHSLILAEGAPAETFVDNVDRLHFDNWAEHEALYPDGKPVEELPYPRAKAHRQVPLDVRLRMAERAHEIGAAETGAEVA